MVERRLLTRSMLTAALVGIAVQAASQEAPRVGRDGYREGMPAVLSPPRPPPRPPETPFAAAYRRAGFPRMVLFFNRDIADTAHGDVTVRRQEVASAESDSRLTARLPSREEAPRAPALAGTGPVKDQTIAIGNPTSGLTVIEEAPATPPDKAERPPAQRQIEIEERGRQQTDRRTEVSVQRPSVGARAAPMDEASQWLFETSFTGRLATERVHMVDRAAAVRLATAARSTVDPQQLEISAIREHADIAVLVRAAPMPSAPGGQIFRVTAVDTRHGTIVADEIVRPPAGSDPAMVASAVGEMAAANLITRLITAWTPAR